MRAVRETSKTRGLETLLLSAWLSKSAGTGDGRHAPPSFSDCSAKRPVCGLG